MNVPSSSPAADTGVDAALLDAFRAGRRSALARAISIVENERPGFERLLHELHGRHGGAHRIGITGPPGAGKSTLTAALIRAFRERRENVGVVAVDPTSPFTGGALLGDRIRMNELSVDEGVFVRSMASRGSLGGLAFTTRAVADVMDAFGFSRIIVETVGVGQSELAVAAAADTTVVVLVPESGDSIQTMKAGLLEASDIFVVNKADRPGADRLARELATAVHLRLRPGGGDAGVYVNMPAHHGADLRRAADAARAGPGDVATAAWEIPVLRTTAHEGAGITELVAQLDAHRTWLDDSDERRHRHQQRLVQRVRDQVDRTLRRMVWMDGPGAGLLDDAADALADGSVTPYEIAATIVRAVRAAPPAD